MKLLNKKDGYKYTQSADVELQDRLILSVICLADTEIEDNWKLITEEEANKIIEEQEELNASRITERNN